MIDPDKIEIITDQVKEYISINLELVKLEVADRISGVISGLVSILIIAVIGFLFLLFISFWAAFYISNLAGDSYTGFAIVAGIYLIPGLLLYISRKKLLTDPIYKNIITNMLNNNKSQ